MDNIVFESQALTFVPAIASRSMSAREDQSALSCWPARERESAVLVRICVDALRGQCKVEALFRLNVVVEYSADSCRDVNLVLVDES